MTVDHRPASDHPSVDEFTYTLFRHRCLPERDCAVPEVRSVLDFIGSEWWAFEQPLRPQKRPCGFDRQAAQVGVRFNGFYLYHAVAAAPALRTTLEFVLGSL